MADAIRFILNGQLREVTGLPPTTTLLQYLRGPARLLGTKEGCAEGDCGACTVAVGRLVHGKVDYKSINACIAFLPTMDGREIVTVEHLKVGGGMNPVQQAMVKCHGSQCGFCTPGFVMALSTLMNNKADAGTEDIQDAIAGNLCRCTGYRPILDAARLANESETRALPADAKSLAGIQRKSMFEYDGGEARGDGGKFFAPTSIEELIIVLQVYPDAVLLGGGTDVGLWVTKMHLNLKTIIYTGNIEALRHVRANEGEGVEIGAAATWEEAFTALAQYDASLRDMLARFASLHIRNAGTVGGNIANGSPIGDGPPALIVLGARLVLNSRMGPRKMPLEDFFIDYRKQDRKEGEFVEKVMVPAKPASVLFRVYKVSKRFDQDISAVCGAFAFDVRDGKVLDARICFGGMAATPKRAAKTEEALRGQAWDETTLEKVMPLLDEDYQPLSDMRASAKYRGDVAKNLLKRFFIETTMPDAETKVYNYGA